MTELPLSELAQGGAAVAVLCWVVWRAIDKLGERMEKRLDDLDMLLTKMVERLARIDMRTAQSHDDGMVTQVVPAEPTMRVGKRRKTPLPTPFTGGDTPPDGSKT